MKRYFNIFFLLPSLLSLICLIRCSAADKPFESAGVSIVSSYNPCYASPFSMQENKPSKKEVILLFRMGIESKGIAFFYNGNTFNTYYSPADASSVNAAHVKEVLSFSGFQQFPAVFLSAFSFRPPPASANV